MSGALVVLRVFGRHKVGDVITDPTTMREILQGEQRASVVATNLPDQQAIRREV